MKFNLKLDSATRAVHFCWKRTTRGRKSESFRSATNAPSRDFREFTLESRTFWIGSTPTRSTTEEPCCFIPLDFCLIVLQIFIRFFFNEKVVNSYWTLVAGDCIFRFMQILRGRSFSGFFFCFISLTNNSRDSIDCAHSQTVPRIFRNIFKQRSSTN